MDSRYLGIIGVGCCLATAMGCAEPAPSADEQPVEAVSSLEVCGFGDVVARRAPQRVEGDAESCFVAFDDTVRIRLTKSPGDLGLLGTELMAERDGVRIYRGRGTRPDGHLYAASMNVAGYTCVVNGFESEEAAQKGAEACSLVEGGES